MEKAARRHQEAIPAPRREPGHGRSEPRWPPGLGGGGEGGGIPGERPKCAREGISAAAARAARDSLDAAESAIAGEV